jgi:hypothetical protein
MMCGPVWLPEYLEISRKMAQKGPRIPLSAIVTISLESGVPSLLEIISTLFMLLSTMVSIISTHDTQFMSPPHLNQSYCCHCGFPSDAVSQEFQPLAHERSHLMKGRVKSLSKERERESYQRYLPIICLSRMDCIEFGGGGDFCSEISDR